MFPSTWHMRTCLAELYGILFSLSLIPGRIPSRRDNGESTSIRARSNDRWTSVECTADAASCCYSCRTTSQLPRAACF